MPVTIIDLPELVGDRAQIRSQLINVFLQEEPGSGTGDFASKYVYNADRLIDGECIQIKRPATLNNGMDFAVHIGGHFFRATATGNRPSHRDIFNDLLLKKSERPREYREVVALINKAYGCEQIGLAQMAAIEGVPGMRVDQLILSLKWLFIEQDVTYWNYSGRAKLMGALRESSLL